MPPVTLQDLAPASLSASADITAGDLAGREYQLLQASQPLTNPQDLVILFAVVVPSAVHRISGQLIVKIRTGALAHSLETRIGTRSGVLPINAQSWTVSYRLTDTAPNSAQVFAYVATGGRDPAVKPRFFVDLGSIGAGGTIPFFPFTLSTVLAGEFTLLRSRAQCATSIVLLEGGLQVDETVWAANTQLNPIPLPGNVNQIQVTNNGGVACRYQLAFNVGL